MSDPNEDNEMARFLVSAPLYRKTEIAERGEDFEFFSQSGFFYISFTKTVKRECVSCGAMMSWDIFGDNRDAQEKVLSAASYRCRNCGDAFQVWIKWEQSPNDKVVLEKCGQFPKFDVNPPKNLEKSLGGYVDFWRMGMTLRHHGYGLGALVYFRRIVEGMTEALLGMLLEAMKASSDLPETISEVRNLIGAKRPFEDKMELPAKMIPQHFRPGGANPFQTIFEIVSGGIHADTDEACCDLVDTLAEGMGLLFANLNTHIEERKKFMEAAKKMETLRTKK